MDDFEILRHTKVDAATINSRLSHPFLDKKYPARYAFIKLQKFAHDFFSSGSEPRMIGLAGLRGVGKTTLLWQIADKVYHNYTKEVYSFNVNTLTTLDISLFDALEFFQEHIIKQRFNTLTTPLALLFDEVHDDRQWSKVLKILYDEARTVFVVATGSSALLLQQTADLTRRMHIEKIYPFKFTEYIQAKTCFDTTYRGNKLGLLAEKGVASALKESLFFSETAEQAFKQLQAQTQVIRTYYQKVDEYAKKADISLSDLLQEYARYHNIPGFLPYKNKALINSSIVGLFKRVIAEDIPRITSDTASYVNSEKLLFRLAASDEVNLQTLSQAIGITQDAISENMEILAKAELMNILLPFGGVDTRLNKARKAFFMSPSLRMALLSVIYGNTLTQDMKAKLYEDLIVMYLKRILPDSILSFVSQQGTNPDFVVETLDKPILVEMGINKTTTRQIHKSQIKYRYGIIINTQTSTLELKGNIIILPLLWFLLL